MTRKFRFADPQCRPGLARWIGLAAFAVSALAASCSRHDLDLGRGGFSAEDDARLSLALAQVRAQSPKDSVSGLIYEARPMPAGLGEPELALIGEGDSLSQGFQTEPKSHLRISVFLDKGSYTRGYAKVRKDNEDEQTWTIVAYLLRGQADRDFQFTYLLAEPNGALRTLMLIGGGYKDHEDDLVAIEGTLFIPNPEPRDKRYSPADWKIAVPVAFVLNEPKEPAYQTLTSQALNLAKDIESEVSEISSLSQRLDELRAKEQTVQAQGGASQKPDAGKDTRIPELEAQIREKASATQDKVIHYFALRGEADTAFASFLEGNTYRWMDADGRQDSFKKWEAPDVDSADMDGLTSQLLAYLQNPAKIDQARSSFRAIVAKNRNGDKRPAPPAN